MIINAPETWVKYPSLLSAAERLDAPVRRSYHRASPATSGNPDIYVNFIQQALCAI
jgi:hypothetical protein